MPGARVADSLADCQASAPAIARRTTAHTASASHAWTRPSVTSHDTRRAAPSSRLATPDLQAGKTMLRSPGS